MAANIKISSDAKQFQQEMQKVTQDLKLMSSELSVSTTKAELFGSAQDKLGAKSKELSNSIKGQNTILGLQKQTISALTGDISKYKDRNTELSKSIADVESKLKDEIKSTGEDSKETKTLQTELNKLQKEYTANEKAIDKSTKQIDTYKIKMNETEKAILQNKKALEDTDKKLKSMDWEKASKGLKSFGNATKDIGQDLTTRVTLPILAAGIASTKLASDMTENINKIDVVFGKSANEVKKWSDTTLEKFGISNLKALEMAGGFGNLAVSMGFTQGKSKEFGEGLTGLTADISSLNNVPMDDVATSLNSIFTGEAEPMRRFGVNMTEAGLGTYALAKGINKPIKEMTDLEKIQLRYNMVMDKTKTAQGDFARSSGSTANQTKIFKSTMEQLGTTFGQQILPLLTPMLQKLNEMLKTVAQMSPATQKIVLVIAGILAAIGPLLMVIGQMSLGLSSLIGLFAPAAAGAGATGGALAALTGPVGLVIAGIVALIAVIVHMWNTNAEFRNNIKVLWQEIRDVFTLTLGYIKEIWGGTWNYLKDYLKASLAFIETVINVFVAVLKDIFAILRDVLTGNWGKLWQDLKSLVGDVLGGIVSIVKAQFDVVISAVRFVADAILQPFVWVRNKVTDTIMDMVNGITSALFGIKLPKIHVDIKWGGPGDAIPYPSFSVKWNAEGGILNKAMIFGAMGNTMLGGGEAGAEGIIPLDKLWSELGKNFDKLEQRLSKNDKSGLTLIIEHFENSRSQDVEALAQELAFYMKQKQIGGSGA